MLNALRLPLAAKLLYWEKSLRQGALGKGGQQPILIFFHGYSLAHTIRPLVIARALRRRGYRVELAGRGVHAALIQGEGFRVHDVETMPQSRMDQFVARGEYNYYSQKWIEDCVRSERALLRKIKPGLVVQDMKPTVSLAVRLEGIDEAQIIPGYKQPGYADPLPLLDCFSTEAGPFDEFLCRHAEEVRPQRTFRLIADIPEFYPPGDRVSGYHYVGPLLDRPKEPRRIAVLDEGWDLSLPLVYITCGSSGRPPDYLDELIEAFGKRAYRLLITTAGRWTKEVGFGNVKVVDFIPGEWVLRRAQMLIGIVGIGTIYQSLGCGVPLIGAPEHLDQEYHLNRVEELGLGVKLDRREFTADRILWALERVLDEYAAYKQRCIVFGKSLSKWQGGEAVADLLDSHFSANEHAYKIEYPYLIEEKEFEYYLDATTPGSLTRADVKELLQEGVKRGLPHQWRGQHLFFDRLDSWNWLYDREPRFFAADYWALEKKRRRFFVHSNRRLQAQSEWQRYRVRYQYRIFPEGLEAGRRAKIFLPYPISEKNQDKISLIACKPGEMERHFAPALGFFYGYSFRVDALDKPLEFAYECDLEVREHRVGAEQEQVWLSAGERETYLELEPRFLEIPEVVQFRRRLGRMGGATVEMRAQGIYESIIQTKRFKKTRERVQNLINSTLSVLRDSGGHCISLSQAFIALCRAEGIPARERAGALIGYPTGAGGYSMKTYREPVFGHTWAEFFLDGRGWIPVEFHGVVIAKGAMTEANVQDPELRIRILENTPKYQQYYFGGLDNQRLYCSNSVKRIPHCLIEQPEYASGDKRRWHAPPDLRFECELQVACT